jgi:pimeloyl-ACP methyl ester carboxylesterase
MTRSKQLVVRGLLLLWVGVAAQSYASAQTRQDLYPNEEILRAAGFPALTWFKKGADPQKPLIVFVPGAAHLGRIAYGCPSCEERNFLAYWMGQRGFSFLAISYPLGHPVYDRAYPEFTVKDWGRQAAEITRTIVDQRHTSNHVVVVGWSMGGKIAKTFNDAAGELGIQVDFFVALAATPPLPNLVPGLSESIKLAPDGLANLEAKYPWFVASLEAQNRLNRREIIPAKIYREEFLGNFPINLLGTELRYRDGAFASDVAESERDMGSHEFARFPLTTVITNRSALDARHALIDQSSWGLYLVQKIFQDLASSHIVLESLAQSKWQCLSAGLRRLPAQLSRTEPGTHFFFVGAKGARSVARDVESLNRQVRQVRTTISGCLATSNR